MGGVEQIDLAQDISQVVSCCENGNEHSGFIK